MRIDTKAKIVYSIAVPEKGTFDMKELNLEQLKSIKRTLSVHGWNLGLIAATLAVALIVIAPANVLADELHPTPAEQQSIDLQVAAMQNSYAEFGQFPQSAERPAPKVMRVLATAYNSDVWQTDSTPFTTASGTTVRHGVIAANFLPIGTKVKIPKYFGDQIFVVEDRMNKRYWHRVDIWMESRDEAKEFGVRNVEIEIYK